MDIENIGITQSIVNKMKLMGYTKLFPIQKKAIPPALQGKNIIGIAQTGSGKTLSFVIPTLMNLESTSKKNRHIDILVLVPTRELAIQILEVYRSIEPALPIRLHSLAVYGGVSINPQMLALQNVNILIATPGRLIDLVSKKAIQLAHVQTLVMDEADKLLNLGFQEELEKILAWLPSKRQNLLYSATLSTKLQSINGLNMDDAQVIEIESPKNELNNIEQLAYVMEESQKGPILRQLINDLEIKRVLIFTSSTHKAERVAGKLLKNGIKARAVHGKKSQGNRNESLNLFKAGKLTALVTTDLLGRGIHIDQLPYVINYELPRSPKDYIHRIGRTGRAEKKGRAITLITKEDEPHFYIIQKKMGERVKIIDINQEVTEQIDNKS